MSLRQRVVDLYKTLYHLGKDYPAGSDFFHKRLKSAFLKNKDEKGPAKVEELFRRGEFVVKEIEALYKLKKYRAMKSRYYESEGSMISILALDRWRIMPVTFDSTNFLNTNCMATYNHEQPNETAHYTHGFLVKLSRYSPADYQKMYDADGFVPPLNSARNLGHTNILDTQGYIMCDDQIVGLCTSRIKEKLSDVHIGDDNKRIELCKQLAYGLQFLESRGILTGPLTYDDDNPNPDTLKFPIIPYTGNLFQSTAKSRFFVEPKGKNLFDYNYSHISYNWAKLVLCILYNGEIDFEKFHLDDYKDRLGVFGSLIRRCLESGDIYLCDVVYDIDNFLFPLSISMPN